MGKERVISQIGDSTDGEDYEDDQHNIAALNKKYLSNPYIVSSILKDIGNQILQNSEVRSKYKEIKKKFIPAEKTNSKYTYLQQQLNATWDKDLKDLDAKLGRGLGILINKYDPKDRVASEVGFANYYRINNTMIEKACGTNSNYKRFSSDAERGEYYLDNKVKIKDNLDKIYKLHKLIEECTQEQRKDIETVTFDSTQNDASLFLAKIKASKKLDKDLGKNHLYDYKHGTGRLISKTSITMKTTQQNETLEICKGGAFKHFKTNEGTYKTIGEGLKKLIDKKFINEKKLKEFFQSSLKGKKCSTIIQKKIVETDLIDQLKADVELIFGIEIKRNPAALLTNAMFFDLVDSGLYKIEHIASKMPMAMKGAVLASVMIDKEMGKLTYDYRENPRGAKDAKDLLKKDKIILKDWLKCKLKINEEIEQNITAYKDFLQLGSNTTVKELQKFIKNNKLDFINTESDEKAAINNIKTKITFKLDDYEGKFILKWNGTEYKVEVCQIHKIKANVFYDLIKEWYGIELPHLNKPDLITLKAAAEPEDPKEDHDYQDDFKVSAIDEGKEEPETAESFEYNMQDNTENSIFIQQYHPELIGAAS